MWLKKKNHFLKIKKNYCLFVNKYFINYTNSDVFFPESRLCKSTKNKYFLVQIEFRPNYIPKSLLSTTVFNVIWGYLVSMGVFMCKRAECAISSP